MIKLSATVILLFLTHAAFATYKPVIINKPIKFGPLRTKLTKEYMRNHYGINRNSIKIVPRMIVLHWTEAHTWQSTWNYFNSQTMQDRPYLIRHGKVNVSAQFLVARNGTIYKLMPDNWMARHVIGLDYMAIGIENVGGVGDKQNLTPAEVNADVYLIRMLKKKYPTIKYLIGHFEYKYFRGSSLWKDTDKSYYTSKTDPGPIFMKEVRARVKDLGLLSRPLHG